MPMLTLAPASLLPVTSRLALASRRRCRYDRGQSTVEYGLMLLVGGTFAIGLLVWARETGLLTGLFDSVFARLTEAI